jgi:hypothetical protein
MTAKEHAAIRTYPTHPCTDGEGNVIRENDFIVMFSGFEFQAFCAQLCKEQREICAEAFEDREYRISDETKIMNIIVNAKMPEL